MNCSIHRTIFNRKRGCLMAVAETAKCSGKASGETRARKRGTCPQAATSKAFRSVASQSVLNSALSRKSSERYAPSQLRSDPFALLLAFSNTSLAFGVRPQMFGASQTTNASLTVNGNLTNNGKLQAGGYLNISSTNLDNRVTGEIAGYITNINATNTVTNRGLIDGVSTQITAGNITNIGTGRIYGDYIGLFANNILNDAETLGNVTVAATIAARQRLDIGISGTLTNTNNALIYSDGHIVIGGALDANRFASGMAGTVINNGATVEATGALVVNASSIQNLNRNFAYTLTTINGNTTVSEYVTGAGTLSGSNAAWIITGSLSNAGPGGGINYQKTACNMLPGEYGYEEYCYNYGVQGQILPGSSPYAANIFRDTYFGSNVVQNGVVNAPSNPAIWTAFNLTAPTTLPPSGPRPYHLMCGTTLDSEGWCNYWVPNTDPALAAWDAAAAPWVTLQNRIDSMRSTVNANVLTFNGWRDYITNSQNITLTSSNPAKMLSGGSMLLNAGTSLVNNMSQIVAGGTLSVTGTQVDNRQLTVTTNNTRVGTAYTWRQYDHGCGSIWGCDYNYQAYGGSGYSLTIPTTTTLGAARSVGSVSTASLSSNAQIAARSNVSAIAQVGTPSLRANITTQDLKAVNVTGRAINISGTPTANTSQVEAARGNVSSANLTANVNAASVLGTNVTAKDVATHATSSNVTTSANITGVTVAPNILSNGTVANLVGGGTHINYAANRTAVGTPTYTINSVGTTVSNNSPFRTPANTTARYFVETDPRFTNNRLWLSSDYMINALGENPQNIQKRLGDGFYEQKLIREQVLALTGTRFLDGYADDETQYADLMSNAVTYAKSYNLRPGIALTDAQMAALTSDIVWLIEKEVTLPNGDKVKALVPQLYTKLRSGDLSESGALLGGANVQMNLTGDATNLGTIAGRNIVSLTANNINNMNSVQGNVVSLDAKTDINVIGGQVQANSALFANAGRNINIASAATASLPSPLVGESQGEGGNRFSYQCFQRDFFRLHFTGFV